jgi:hypothetical protein
MHKGSTIDTLVENALTELESEFENEMSAEFEDVHLPNYKWIVYAPVKGGWKQERWVQSKGRVDVAEADRCQKKLFSYLASSMNPLVEEVVVRRCRLEQDGWAPRGCWRVEIGTTRVSPCGKGGPALDCSTSGPAFALF